MFSHCFKDSLATFSNHSVRNCMTLFEFNAFTRIDVWCRSISSRVRSRNCTLTSRLLSKHWTNLTLCRSRHFSYWVRCSPWRSYHLGARSSTITMEESSNAYHDPLSQMQHTRILKSMHEYIIDSVLYPEQYTDRAIQLERSNRLVMS